MSDALKSLIPDSEKHAYGGYLKASDVPVWKYWEAFVEDRRRFKRSDRTTKSVRDTLRRLIREKQLINLSDINDRNKVQSALLELKDEREFSDSTYNTYRKNIMTYLIWLEQEDIISEIKTRKVRKFPEVIPAQYTLNSEQVQQVIAHLNTRKETTLLRLRNIAFIYILFIVGARPSEIEKLTLDSIKKDGSEWQLEVVGSKNVSTRRPYILPSHIKDALISYITYRKSININEPFLFCSRKRGKAWTSKGMRAFLKKLSKEVGFTVGMRASRRYVATTLAENGVPLERIADHLGHKRISTTKRYIEGTGLLTKNGINILSRHTLPLQKVAL